MTQDQPTVFIVDDDRAVLQSLKLLLRTVKLDAELFSSATEFLQAYDPERPGCLVLDVRMPGMSGLELQQRLVELGSTLPIVFVTAHGDVPMAVEAVKAGAIDFLQKPFRDQELLDRVERAIEKNAQMRNIVAEMEDIDRRIGSLTPRERQIMRLIVAGRANKVIAGELGISQRTVEIHRSRVMKKMQADSVSQLVRMLVRTEGTS